MIGISSSVAIATPLSSALNIDMARFIAPKVMSTLLGVLALILVDTFMGILLSLRQAQFNFRKLPQFLKTNVLPYVGGLFVLGVAAAGSAELGTIFYAAAATTGAKYLMEIKDKVVILFGKNIIKP